MLGSNPKHGKSTAGSSGDEQETISTSAKSHDEIYTRLLPLESSSTSEPRVYTLRLRVSPSKEKPQRSKRLRESKGDSPIAQESFKRAKASQPDSVKNENVTTTTTTTDTTYDFGVISWNIDGLSEATVIPRTLAVIDHIRRLKPSCILLQEIVPLSESMIRKYLGSPYNILVQAEKSDWEPFIGCPRSSSSCTRMPYYCTILLSKFHYTKPSNLSTADTYYFPNTQMGRALLSVRTHSVDGNVPVCLATSHLESTSDADCSKRRRAQISLIFEWIQETALSLGDNGLLLFSGDLNIRDSEVKEYSEFLKASGIVDVWEALGADDSHRWTWDRRTNCNLGPCSTVRGPRFRFDRMYCWRGSSCPLKLKRFELIGKEMIDPVDFRYFPSDHYGLCLSLAT